MSTTPPQSKRSEELSAIEIDVPLNVNMVRLRYGGRKLTMLAVIDEVTCLELEPASSLSEPIDADNQREAE